MEFVIDGTKIHFRPDQAEPPCAASANYPEPRVVRPNLYYAMLIQDAFAGPAGKLGAAAQYFYHYQVLSKKHPVASQVMLRIFWVELYHLYLLGSVIQLLGGEPKYVSFFHDPWMSSQLFYGQDLHDRLAADLHLERSSIRHYSDMKMDVEDPFLQLLLERLVQDEETHVEALFWLMRNT